MQEQVIRDNRGFSLVEMIVVIVIIGIASVGVMIGFGQVNRLHSDEGLNALASSLDRARYQAMSKDDSCLYLYSDNGYYYACLDDSEPEKLFSTQFSIIVQNSSLADTISTDDTFYVDGLSYSPIMQVTFDKSTGKLKEIKTNDETFTDNAEISTTNGNVTIKITNNGRVRVE